MTDDQAERLIKVIADLSESLKQVINLSLMTDIERIAMSAVRGSEPQRVVADLSGAVNAQRVPTTPDTPSQ